MFARKQHNTVTQLSFKNIYFGLIKHLPNSSLFVIHTHKEDLKIFPLKGMFVIQNTFFAIPMTQTLTFIRNTTSMLISKKLGNHNIFNGV